MWDVYELPIWKFLGKFINDTPWDQWSRSPPNVGVPHRCESSHVPMNLDDHIWHEHQSCSSYFFHFDDFSGGSVQWLVTKVGKIFQMFSVHVIFFFFNITSFFFWQYHTKLPRNIEKKDVHWLFKQCSFKWYCKIQLTFVISQKSTYTETLGDFLNFHHKDGLSITNGGRMKKHFFYI